MSKRRISFKNWCKKDLKDERKINYLARRYENPERFTSEENVGFSMLSWLREYAKVDKAELKNGEWFVELSE